MTYIKTIPADEADGEVQQLYQRQQGRKEYVPNYAYVFCYRPGVMQAWAELQREIRRHMDFRQYELITLAAARELKNSYCALAHGKVLLSRFYSEKQLTDIVNDSDTLELSDKDRAIMALARQVVRDSSAVTGEQIDQLRRFSVSDEEIFDIVAAAAARCFFSRIPDALGVRPDSVFNEMPEALKQALIVGRTIEPVKDGL